jgi:hypothetical protein
VQLTFDHAPERKPAKGRPPAGGVGKLLRALDRLGLSPDARRAAAALVLELDRGTSPGDAKGRGATRPDAQQIEPRREGVAEG